MKVAVLVADPLLGSALVDLLRGCGHEAHRYENAVEGSRLRIVTDDAQDAPAGCATLVLQRGPGHAPDRDPAAALRAALETHGTAVWQAPLDTALLHAVLAEGASPQQPEPAVVPDLASAPHAWLVLEPTLGQLVSANSEARALLHLPPEPVGLGLEDLPCGPHLRDAVREESEGLRETRIAGVPHLSAWWTTDRGRRIVCFLPSPAHTRHADRAGRALADLGRMAATLAHEIRNPVASLAGALELLQHEEDRAERDEILLMAQARLKQLSRLLEKTLNLARPIDGPTEVVELQPVIASAVSTMRMDPHFADVRISVDAPADTVRVRALEGPLLQALLNLLLNAAQVQDGDGAVHVTLEVDRGRALLRVHDEGPGIPPDKREQIFKPFYTTRASGTGLGLAEVRRALTAFDGEIEVLDVTPGACLQMVLPLATGDA